MNTTLDDPAFNALSVFPAQDDPSLAELLLSASDAAEYEEEAAKKSVTKNKNAAAAGTRSRKSRRGNSSQAKSRKRAARSNDSSYRRSQRMKAKQQAKQRKKQQDENAQRAATYQQSAAASESHSTITGGPATAGSGVDKTRAIELKSYSRPVVLGLFDYLPWFENGDQDTRTAAGNIAHINFAKKHMNLRDIIVKEQYTSYTPELVDFSQLTEYQVYLTTFLKNLDIMTQAEGQHAQQLMDYLSIDNLTASEASNTEILMTLIRDLSCALQGCSMRLVEAEQRRFEVGPSLPPSPLEVSLLGKTALAQTSNFMEYYEASMSGYDVEQVCKILLNTISQEIKMSINKKKTGETQTIDEIMQVSPARESMMPDAQGLGPFGVVQASTPEQANYQFPFEAAEISDFNNTKFDSAMDYIKTRLAARAEAVMTDGEYPNSISNAEVYTTTNDSVNQATARIESLLSYTWCSDVNVAGSVQNSQCFSQFVFRTCMDAFKNVMWEEGTELTKANGLQLYILSLAANDAEIMRALILYLAALRDYIPPEPPPPSFNFGNFGAVQTNASIAAMLDAVGAISSTTFSAEPFASPYSSSPELSTPAAPIVETATSSYASHMQAATSYASGPMSGAASRNYVSSIVDSDGAASTNSMASFIGNSIGEQEMDATEFVNSAFAAQAASIAQFLFEKIQKRSSGEAPTSYQYANGQTSNNFYFYTLDEGIITDALSQEPTQDNIFTRLLASWETLSTFSLTGNTMEDVDNPGTTNYSGFPIQNLETAFLICCTKMIDSVCSSAWSVTDQSLDSPELTLMAQSDLFTFVRFGFQYLWQHNFPYNSNNPATPYLTQVAIIQDALKVEEVASFNAPGLLSSYFALVNLSWQQFITQAKDTIEIGGEQLTVAQYMARGSETASSSDSLAYLMSCNSATGGMECGLHTATPAGTSLETLVDGTTGNDTQKIQNFLTTRILNIDRDESPTRLLTVALPNGLLDSLEADPVSITDLNRSSHLINKHIYEVILEKIDVTRPDLTYKPKKYYFPRKVQARYWDYSNGWQQGAQNAYGLWGTFTKFESMSSTTFSDYLTITYPHNASWGTVAPEQKAKSEALKLYIEHMYGVSLRLHDFPAGDAQLESVKSPTVPIPAWSGIDTTSSTFLSASNLASMPRVKEKFPNNLSWWNSTTNTIDFGGKGENFPTSPEEYALLSFINTYGSIPAPDYYTKVSSGLIFEDIACIEFNHRNWEIESTGDQSANLSAAEAEEVSGVQTSSGLDFGQYRVTIRIPELDEQIEPEFTLHGDDMGLYNE